MFIYKVKENCNLTVQGRKRFFRKNEEVEESAYTKAFPKYFKKIGEIEIKKPLQAIIMKPISTRKEEAIETFIEKEKILKDEDFKEVNNVEEIVDTYEENEQVNKQKTQENKNTKQKTSMAKEQKEEQDQKQFQEIEELVDTFEPPVISDTILSQE